MIRSAALMGTIVTVDVVDADRRHGAGAAEGIARAFGWFERVEACCTRFDPQSELMQLRAHIGVPVPASDILLKAVQFALTVAEESGGAFDPTVGYAMETRGFNREHRTGQVVRTPLDPGGPVSYRDVHVDADRRTVTLARPLILDLGAVAKGLAIDLAAQDLRPFENFAIDAGGDLYLGGHRADGGPWSVGIRHPRQDRQLIQALCVSDAAVCTSGDYERPRPHILDPRSGVSVGPERPGGPGDHVASVTVVAPTAMAADALATAAFVLGPTEGIRLLERQGVDGLIVSRTLEQHATRGLCSSVR